MQAGERRASRGPIGYFHQHQLDMLDVDSTPLAHLARLAPEAREQELRNYLGGFGFSGDTVSGKVGPMSGGESPAGAVAHRLAKAQPAAAGRTQQPPGRGNPRSPGRRAGGFGGSMLLVSHDRHLLRTVDSFWIVADGAVREFDGDLEDYRDWLAARNAGERAARGAEGADPVVDRKAQRRAEAEQRQRLAALRKPLEARLAKVETEMEKLRAKLQALDATIADPDLCTPTNAAPNARRSWPSTANTASAWTSWKSSGWSCKARWRKSGSPKPDDKRRATSLLDCRSTRPFDINNYYHLYFVANLALTADRAGVMSTLTDVFLRHYRELLGFLSLRTGSRDVARTAPMTPGSSWRNSVTARARTMTAPTSSASPPISPPTGTVGAA